MYYAPLTAHFLMVLGAPACLMAARSRAALTARLAFDNASNRAESIIHGARVGEEKGEVWVNHHDLAAGAKVLGILVSTASTKVVFRQDLVGVRHFSGWALRERLLHSVGVRGGWALA